MWGRPVLLRIKPFPQCQGLALRDRMLWWLCLCLRMCVCVYVDNSTLYSCVFVFVLIHICVCAWGTLVHRSSLYLCVLVFVHPCACACVRPSIVTLSEPLSHTHSLKCHPKQGHLFYLWNAVCWGGCHFEFLEKRRVQEIIYLFVCVRMFVVPFIDWLFYKIPVVCFRIPTFQERTKHNII